jgi:small subunit ribosomal protein S1
MEHEELGKSEENPTSAELSNSTEVPTPREEATPAAEAAAPDASTAASAADKPPFERGALIEGVVVETSPTQIKLDLGDGREGFITSSEIEWMDSKRLAEDFAVGNRIRVVVTNPRNKDGRTVLSYIAALEEADWEMAAKYAASKEIYNGRVGGYNSGGLIVRFGRLRGFVPHSQISEARLRNLPGSSPEARYTQLINQYIDVKVIEVNRSQNRLILSERAAEREARQARKQKLITELQVGEERDGVVTSLESFGAFVDIGGAEGLVHLSELTHQHITHPRQAVSVGEKVRVRVIGIDTENNRIALSRKALMPDPWDEIAVRYPSGTLVRGTVTKIASFGAFARIEGAEHVEGLIHISELSHDRIEDAKEVVKKGDVLTLRVLRVNIAEKRLALSLKAVFSSEYLDQDIEMAYTHPELVAVPEKSGKNKRSSNLREKAAAAVEVVGEKVEEALESAQETAAEVAETISQTLEDAREIVSETVDSLREAASEVAEDVREKVDDLRQEISQRVEETRESAGEAVEDARESENEVKEQTDR